MRVNQFNQSLRLFSTFVRKSDYSDSASTRGVIIKQHIIRNLIIILIVGLALLLTPIASVGPSSQMQNLSFCGSSVRVSDGIFLGGKNQWDEDHKGNDVVRRARALDDVQFR